MSEQFPNHSWSWYMISPHGCRVLLNLKGDVLFGDDAAKSLHKQFMITVDKLTNEGWRPDGSFSTASGKEETAEQPAEGTQDWCSIHQCKMYRHEKSGQVWYSHKTNDEAYAKQKNYCNGKPPR